MKRKGISVPTLYWHEKRNLILNFPKRWDVQIHHMTGYNAPGLNDEQIRIRIAKPINADAIRDLASQRTEAVVIFDDMTRPTQCFRIVPHVINELSKGGISDEHVRFVVALGAHGVNTRMDFAKKLGQEVVERFPVYNHNPFGNLRDLGSTKRGTPVQISEEVMRCDLKIGIGSVLPHSMAGFGGGGKIILPGVSSVESICHNHCDIGHDCHEHGAWSGWKPVEGNESRADIDEASRMAGLDFKIDAIVNERGEISDLLAGDSIDAWRKGVEIAKKTYSTKTQTDFDVVVANAYLKANQAVSAMNIATHAVREGGTVVLIANSPEGQCLHYLYGKFGKKIGGKLRSRPPSYPKKVTTIVYSQYKEKDPLLEIADSERLVWTKTWSETIEAVASSIVTDSPKVGIFPAACIQVPAQFS